MVYTETSSSSSDAVAAGLIGFTAGIAIGAAIDNDYYYGPYGWGGGAYMYNDTWDDWYDEREDMREDWQDHREDLVEERGDRARDQQEQRTERQQTQQQQRTERQQTRQGNPEAQAQREQRRTDAQAAGQERRAVADQSGSARLQPREWSGCAGAEWHQRGCLLGLFERPIRTGRQPARTAQSQQLARRRIATPVTAAIEQHVTNMTIESPHQIKRRVKGVVAAVTCVCAMLGALAACTAAGPAQQRKFSTAGRSGARAG